jgi:hypothetical protein
MLMRDMFAQSLLGGLDGALSEAVATGNISNDRPLVYETFPAIIRKAVFERWTVVAYDFGWHSVAGCHLKMKQLHSSTWSR